MGLIGILVFSALTGISFGFVLSSSGDSSGVGINFFIYDYFSDFLDSNLKMLLTIVSSIFTIFFIFRLARFFREVYEHRLAGIATAVLGFSGSILIVLAPQENSLVLGIGVWILGLCLVFSKRKSS